MSEKSLSGDLSYKIAVEIGECMAVTRRLWNDVYSHYRETGILMDLDLMGDIADFDRKLIEYREACEKRAHP